MKTLIQQRKLVAGCSVFLICFLFSAAIGFYRYFTVFDEEKAFFRNHRQAFSEILFTAENTTTTTGCVTLSPSSEIESQTTLTETCYTTDGQVEFLVVGVDSFDKAYCFIPDVHGNENALRFGNRSNSVTIHFRFGSLDDHWYLCSLNN